MKRIFICAVTVLLIFAMVGCNNTASPQPTADTKNQVAIIVCSAEMRSSSNQSVWSAAMQYAKPRSIRIKWFMAETNAEAKGVLDDVVAQGFNIVICANGNIDEALTAHAKANPDVKYAMIDGLTNPEGQSNLLQGSVRAEQSGFLAGYIAAMRSESRKVACVGGTYNVPGEVVIKGFEAGVKYAEAELGYSIEFAFDYVGSAYNRDGGYDMADRFYALGVDQLVIGTGGETAGGAMWAAKVLNKECITMGDTAYIAPDNVVACVAKKIDAACLEVITGLCEGTIQGGQTLKFGVADGKAGLIDTPAARAALGEELWAKVTAVQDKIASGEIKISLA